MNHGKAAAIILAAFSVALPASALAAVFANHEVVDVTEPVKDDVFLAGERVTVEESIQDDAFIAGGTVDVTGPIGEDLMAAGDSVSVSSAIGDDTFVVGESVVLAAQTDDLFAAGRSIDVKANNAVSGDAYLAGSSITLRGTFAGDVRVASESVNVASGTTIAGNLVVYSANDPVIASDAKIAGTVRHVTATAKEKTGAQSYFLMWLRSVLSWFLTGLVLLYLAPRLGALVTERVYGNTLLSFGIGLIWLIVMIPVTLALLLTVVGWPLAVIGLCLSGLVVILSVSLLPLVVGTWLHQRISFATVNLTKPWQHVLLGAIVVPTIKLLPIIGPLLMFVIMVAVMGVLIQNMKKNA